jgi:hypothetical protein
MDIIALPMVSRSASVNDALGILKTNPRGGVILEGDKDKYSLLWTGRLLEAKAHGIKKLSRLEDVDDVYLASNKDAKLHKIDLIRPFRTAIQYTEFFNSIGCDYTLFGAGQDLAMIITKSETFAWTLASTGGYQCTGPTIHYFPKPRVNAGEICPLCPDPLPGGGRATVRPSL